MDVGYRFIYFLIVLRIYYEYRLSWSYSFRRRDFREGGVNAFNQSFIRNFRQYTVDLFCVFFILTCRLVVLGPECKEIFDWAVLAVGGSDLIWKIAEGFRREQPQRTGPRNPGGRVTNEDNSNERQPLLLQPPS